MGLLLLPVNSRRGRILKGHLPEGQARSKHPGEWVDGQKGPEFWLRASQLACADLNKPLPTSPKYPLPILIAIATVY